MYSRRKPCISKYIGVGGGRVNSYAALRRVTEGRWVQPRFTSASNEHGTVSASGSTNARPGWGAFDGWVGDVGPGNASGFGAAQWTKSASNMFLSIMPAWVELRLNYMIDCGCERNYIKYNKVLFDEYIHKCDT